MKLPPLVSVEWLAEHKNDSNLVILDASTLHNKSGLVPLFPNLQIEGAIPFDMENVFLNKESSIPNMFPSPLIFEKECQKLGINQNTTLVVYDNLGIYTSPRAWWMFKTMGHENVAVLNGGLPSWKKAGFPCEEKNSTIIIEKGNFKTEFNTDFVVSSSYILDNLNNTAIEIVDARSGNRFSGLEPEPREGMGSGHIPYSKNLPYKLVLSNGEMKSKQELKLIFRNFNKGDRTLFTCGSGVTACILLLANALVNSQPKALFDGSWSEWGQEGQFPVEKN